jgi:hypothetical protein
MWQWTRTESRNGSSTERYPYTTAGKMTVMRVHDRDARALVRGIGLIGLERESSIVGLAIADRFGASDSRPERCKAAACPLGRRVCTSHAKPTFAADPRPTRCEGGEGVSYQWIGDAAPVTRATMLRIRHKSYVDAN